MIHAIKYSTKVWLTGVIFSPIVFIMFFSTLAEGSQAPDLNNALDFTGLMLVFGLLYSIPSWIFLVLTSGLLFHFMKKEFLARGIIWLISMLLCFLPFLYFGFNFRNNELSLILPYFITISFGVWYYKLRPDISTHTEVAEKEETLQSPGE
jgi:hypothetical protein